MALLAAAAAAEVIVEVVIVNMVDKATEMSSIFSRKAKEVEEIKLAVSVRSFVSSSLVLAVLALVFSSTKLP